MNYGDDYLDLATFFWDEGSRKAIVMAKVRSLLVDVMKDEARWKLFAGKVKGDNLRKPAFQEEFSRVISEWGELVALQ